MVKSQESESSWVEKIPRNILRRGESRRRNQVSIMKIVEGSREYLQQPDLSIDPETPEKRERVFNIVEI